MARLPRWLSTLQLMMIAGAWSSAMIVVGSLAILEWPTRLGSWGKPGMMLGAVLVAGGLYTFAFFTGRAFPLANARIKAMFELLPWTALVALIAGGLAH